MGATRRRTGQQRGAAIVETILVILLLLFVMFGMVELGRAWFTQQLATAAVREAVRIGAVESDSTKVSSDGLTRMTAVLNAGGIPTANIVSSSVTLQPLGADKQVVANVTVRFRTVFPLLLPVLKQIDIPQSATMRWEFSGS